MVMDMCQSVAFKRLFTCLLVLPVVALWCVPTASAQPVGENGRKLDFVYSPCVFDSCYTLFMRIARPLNSDTSLHAQLFMTRSTAPTRGVSGVFNSRQIQAYGRAKKVRKMYEEIHSNPAYDEAEEKQRLVQQLCSFSDTAHALPIVYAVIANDYGGGCGGLRGCLVPSLGLDQQAADEAPDAFAFCAQNAARYGLPVRRGAPDVPIVGGKGMSCCRR